MAKKEKYKVLSPFPSKGKVFARHGEIVSSDDIARQDIAIRLEKGYIEKVVEEKKKTEDTQKEYKNESSGFSNPFKKKKKRR